MRFLRLHLLVSKFWVLIFLLLLGSCCAPVMTLEAEVSRSYYQIDPVGCVRALEVKGLVGGEHMDVYRFPVTPGHQTILTFTKVELDELDGGHESFGHELSVESDAQIEEKSIGENRKEFLITAGEVETFGMLEVYAYPSADYEFTYRQTPIHDHGN
ncbi:hypothetical protein [Pontibacter sp. G13]|uniref:hypothetical protein n=1 Tax=Pontibacter sp. G13 TaxID=3074898 RepID=UPI00288B842D|nr:hypothetical protein [Pontibacter sp. G13]WNJ20693.1 hypothetical protein RJD25_09445 [Pontibacter sp. G13]